ncbi:MAG TPA: URC4/urg3 family protein [Acetobacteraceae bacterium]|nr:URC4/urg3 family protein [Acetobacteraceae bacterium]
MTAIADPATRRALTWLRTPEAVRERCNALLALAEQDALPHFKLDSARLDDTANYVAAVIRANYPDLVIPYHSRWRHFEAGGIDRWRALAATLTSCDPAELTRLRLDLCTISVLLDAGAGAAWSFREPDTGQLLTRSEGLAVASLHAFRTGLFSGDPHRPLRADANGLSHLSEHALAAAFQVTPTNPLAGLTGRVALLHNLGATLRRRPDLFGDPPRVGTLADHLRTPLRPARNILITILESLAPIWPGRLTLNGENLGDVWPHPALTSPLPLAGKSLPPGMEPGVGSRSEPGEGLIPFHKLSQWLTYSLFEILEDSGTTVTDLDALTGLAEYRNGGLFIDLGVLRMRDLSLVATPIPVDHPAIVEWRALTVALLDRLAPLLRARLNRTAADLPLPCLLQGGTWAAGRNIARERRADASPPLHVQSDGTVF